MSSDITDQLLSISRHLADTTQRSADTLQTLGMAVFQFYYYICLYKPVVTYLVAFFSFYKDITVINKFSGNSGCFNKQFSSYSINPQKYMLRLQ